MARPASFDREQVLGRATAVFWEHGYCDTSIHQLVQATRLKPGSLYAAFTSKEGLFLEALAHYAQQSQRRMRAAFADAPDPLQGIEALLNQLVDDPPPGQVGRGCLLVNAVVELGKQNPRVQAQVRRHLADNERLFEQALRDAQAMGRLAADKSPQALAKFLITTLWGLRVLKATGADPASGRLVVRQAMAAVTG